MTIPDRAGSGPDGTLPEFIGAKAAFFLGTRLLCYLRDDFPGLIWRNHWDLPGGGREDDETPEACLLRELHEEFGLSLPASRLEQRLVLPSVDFPGRVSVFFAGRITESDLAALRFGSEGQRWEMMEVEEFLARRDAVPWLQDRVRRVWSGFQPANQPAR
ncbi:NUDIX hydrolase [Neotabrizicola sp. sgz301269]|uniref:NUDIX hydrolase n=1 Tax=Neotabrizicola sp. sgz301269 TaxID=3276282 RepID=UPI0037701691